MGGGGPAGTRGGVSQDGRADGDADVETGRGVDPGRRGRGEPFGIERHIARIEPPRTGRLLDHRQDRAG